MIPTQHKKKYRKHVLTTSRLLNQCHKPIIFTLRDGKGITFPYKDALVISTTLFNHQVYRVLVDKYSAINILSYEVMTQNKIFPLRLTLVKAQLIGIKGLDIPLKGVVEVPITITTPLKCASLQ